MEVSKDIMSHMGEKVAYIDDDEVYTIIGVKNIIDMKFEESLRTGIHFIIRRVDPVAEIIEHPDDLRVVVENDRALTEMEKAYAKKYQCQCPYGNCHSIHVRMKERLYNQDVISEVYECHDCTGDWKLIYTVTDVETV